MEKVMAGMPIDLPTEINRKSVILERHIIERYVEKYDMSEFNNNEFEIIIENDSVMFYENGEKGGVLSAENDSTFFGYPTDENYFVFRIGKKESFNLIFKYKGVNIVGEKK